jgi:HEAT repeat protein
MRAKVILSVAFLALAILLPAVYFHYKSARPPAVEQPVASDDTAPPAALPPILKRVVQDRPKEGLPARPASPVSLIGSDHDKYVLERKAQLVDLGMSDNPANLKSILAEMENPEPEIRRAALSATVQFGSKDAIPVLQNEMSYATDPQEKVDIQKAIEFLQLPTFGSGGDAITRQSNDGSAPSGN